MQDLLAQTGQEIEQLKSDININLNMKWIEFEEMWLKSYKKEKKKGVDK